MKINQSNSHDTEKQCIPPIPVTNLLLAAINGIVSVIVAYFFAPLWQKFMSWWKNEV